MTTQDAAAGPGLPSGRVTERVARFLPGLRMLVLGIVLLLGGWRWPCWQPICITVRKQR